MIYFFINIPLNELAKLEDTLPKGCYCLFQMQNTSNRYYGIIRKDSYPIMLQTLTEDSKKNVEMLEIKPGSYVTQEPSKEELKRREKLAKEST